MPKNHVIDYQKFYQANANTPLWLRHPRSKFLVYPAYALFWTTSVAVPLYYFSRAVLGIRERE